MKATLKTAQMGLAAGVVVEVVNRGIRACVVQGAAKEVSVTVPTEDLVFEEPSAPEPPAEPHFSTAPSDLDGNYGEQTALDDHLDEMLMESQEPEDADLDESPADPFEVVDGDLDGLDDDLDEALPEPQKDCTEGESCESCQ